MVGVDNADTVGEPLLGVDEGTTYRLKVLAGADRNQLSAYFLNGSFHPILVPAIGLDQGTQLLGGEILYAIDSWRVLKVGRKRRDENVFIQIEGADNGVGPLGTIHWHGGFTRVAQLFEHLPSFAFGAVVLLDEDFFEVVGCALVFQEGHDVDSGKLLLQILQTNADHNLLFAFLPELTHDGDTFFVHEIGAHFNFALDFGDLRLDHPAHKVTHQLTAGTIFRTNGDSGEVRAFEGHSLHCHFLVDDVINEEAAQIASTIPRGGTYFATFAGMFLAIGRLTVPNSVTRLVVEAALVNERLVVAHAIFKGFLQQIEVWTFVFRRGQLQARV